MYIDIHACVCVYVYIMCTYKCKYICFQSGVGSVLRHFCYANERFGLLILRTKGITVGKGKEGGQGGKEGGCVARKIGETEGIEVDV